MSDASDVHVVGGGLAGLAAAALVARAGHTVTVHESRTRLGGRATTDAHDGFRFNQGPHALYRKGPAEEVLAELGIRPAGAKPPLRGSMAMRGGRVERLPVGPGSLARTGLFDARDTADFGRAMLHLARADAPAHAGQTVAELLDGLTDRPAVRQVVEALIRVATYVEAPHLLSAEVAISQLYAAVRHGVLYLHHGWEQLVRAVMETGAAAGVRFAAGERLTGLPDAPAVIVAAGGPEAAAVLIGHPYDSGIEAAASVLDLGLSGPPGHSFVLGIDEHRYLSDHGVADGMAPPGRWTLSAAAYLEPGAEATPREVLRSYAERAGVDPGTVVAERYLHRMPVVTAIATAAGGGLAGRPPVQVPDRPGVFVAGDWVGPEGHMVDAALASARAAATAAVAHLSRRPVTR